MRSSCERASATSLQYSGTMLHGGAAVDQSDVRGRLLVDPAEPHLGDRLGGGEDRRAALLRVHARVRGAAVERDVELLRRRRAEDDVADRRGLVVDVADLRAQARVVERERAEQADLFLRREEQLDPGVRAVLGEHAARGLEHGGDGRLVVGAEDRLPRVADDAVLDDRLDRVLGGTVSRCAQRKSGSPSAVGSSAA